MANWTILVHDEGFIVRTAEYTRCPLMHKMQSLPQIELRLRPLGLSPVFLPTFMSISPTDGAHRSASPSFQLPENPTSSEHGSPPGPRRPPRVETEGLSADNRAGSAQICAPDESNGPPAESSGGFSPDLEFPGYEFLV